MKKAGMLFSAWLALGPGCSGPLWAGKPARFLYGVSTHYDQTDLKARYDAATPLLWELGVNSVRDELHWNKIDDRPSEVILTSRMPNGSSVRILIRFNEPYLLSPEASHTFQFAERKNVSPRTDRARVDLFRDPRAPLMMMDIRLEQESGFLAFDPNDEADRQLQAFQRAGLEHGIRWEWLASRTTLGNPGGADHSAEPAASGDSPVRVMALPSDILSTTPPG